MNVPVRVAEEDLFAVARTMSRWVERVLGSGLHRYRHGDSWSPSINLYEDATAYLLVVDLAGVEPDKVDLQVERGQLVLRGQRPAPLPAGHGDVGRCQGNPLRLHLMEIDHGPFRRALELPRAVDGERIEASYRSGFLWVRMPKKGGSK